MKTYTFDDLKKIAREQGYKLAALENMNGEKIVSFNKINKPIEDHLKIIQTRLKSDIHPSGVYNVCLSHSISKNRTPDRYAVTKGNVSAELLEEIENKNIPVSPVIVEKNPDVLTWDSAIQMNKTIAEQAARISQLEFENSALQLRVEELEIELEEEGEGLTEGTQGQGTIGAVKDLITNLTPGLDKWLEIEKEKLELRKMEVLLKHQGRPSGTRTKPKIKEIVPGSQEHLKLIQMLAGMDDEISGAKLDKELDKLQAANPALYEQVCNELGLFEEGGE